MYPGQKNIPGVIHKIINQIPEFTDFYEPYCGSSAVSSFLSVGDLNRKFYLNDLDSTAKLFLPVRSCMSFSSVPAIDIIQSLRAVPAGSGVFVFIDPPYLHETRPNQTDLYKFEMSLKDHISLLRILQSFPHKTMVIHPVCDLYNFFLLKWRKKEVKIRYNRKTSIECLYMNYDPPEKLATYSVLGSDCWDRQRIKRKCQRTIQKFSSMPDLERNKILSALYNQFPLQLKNKKSTS